MVRKRKSSRMSSCERLRALTSPSGRLARPAGAGEITSGHAVWAVVPRGPRDAGGTPPTRRRGRPLASDGWVGGGSADACGTETRSRPVENEKEVELIAA
jgi:hypothetical protein